MESDSIGGEFGRFSRLFGRDGVTPGSVKAPPKASLRLLVGGGRPGGFAGLWDGCCGGCVGGGSRSL